MSTLGILVVCLYTTLMIAPHLATSNEKTKNCTRNESKKVFH